MDTRKIIAELRRERDRINQAIAALEAISPDGAQPKRQPARQSAAVSTARPRRRMSAAARKKLSAMMKARWAARKKNKGA